MPAGNLNTCRSIMDVRDLVRALWLAPEHCAQGEAYNISGNRIYSVQELIDTIRAEAKASFSVEQDPALVRKCDEPVIAGDTTKFQNCSGWAPEIALSRTLREMLHWWRSRLSANPSSSLSQESRPHDLLV
jgi:GDP-4-dehydro-6-deoxy-D-mannose reductase